MNDKDHSTNRALELIALNLIELRRISEHQQNNNAILNRIAELESNIMGKLTDFLNQQKAYNAQSKTAIDSIAATVTEVAADVDGLLAKIEELNNNPGVFTPEDQALVDQLITEGAEAAGKLTTAAETLAAINSKVPPVVPTVPANQ